MHYLPTDMSQLIAALLGAVAGSLCPRAARPTERLTACLLGFVAGIYGALPLMTYWHLPAEMKGFAAALTAFVSPPALVAFREGFANRNWKGVSQRLIPKEPPDESSDN